MSEHPKSYVITSALTLISLAAAAFFIHQYAVMPPAPAHPKPAHIKGELRPLFRFDLSDPDVIRSWREKKFHGKTVFEIVTAEDNQKVLKAESSASSSILLKEAKVPILEQPRLVWEWKAVQFPGGKKNRTLAAKQDNDFAARVYVAFKADNPLQQEVIQYVWDDHFPKGASASSSFGKTIKVMVVESGPGGWAREDRDIAADYEKLFGKPAEKDIAGIGITSDSDNTKTSSLAYFKTLSILIPSGESNPQRHPQPENGIEKALNIAAGAGAGTAAAVGNAGKAVLDGIASIGKGIIPRRD